MFNFFKRKQKTAKNTTSNTFVRFDDVAGNELIIEVKPFENSNLFYIHNSNNTNTTIILDKELCTILGYALLEYSETEKIDNLIKTLEN